MRIFKSKTYYILCALPITAGFVFGFLYGSVFEILCAACSLLFLAIQFSLRSYLEIDTKAEKEQDRPVSFFLLLPPIITIAAGILLIFSPSISVGNQSWLAIALSIGFLVLLLFRLISVWKDTSLAGKLLRFTVAATMSAPLSLVISLLLYLTNTEDAMVMSSMTTIIFGVLAFLAMANIIIVSYCDYKRTAESIRFISKAIKERKLIFTRVSILKDIFLVVGKGILSVISVSFFMFVNALYSAGMGIARFLAVRMHNEDKKEQVKSYRYVGIIISISSICYVLYSVRLFFGGKTGDYDMYIALVIALYTFVEFGINIKEAIRLHKSKALEAKALRATSFSSTLICFVLTQTAIMSFAGEGDNGFANALSGVVFGTLASLVGLYVILDSISNKKKLEQQ